MGIASREAGTPDSRVIVRNDVLGGMPCVSGTRVPAMTIVAELRAGSTRAEIMDGYPSLPMGGVDAVCRWAAEKGIDIEDGSSS